MYLKLTKPTCCDKCMICCIGTETMLILSAKP